MTPLSKPVTRRALRPFMHYGKRLVVTLEPGDLLSLRLERDRSRVSIPLAELYRELLTREARAKRAEVVKQPAEKRRASKQRSDRR